MQMVVAVVRPNKVEAIRSALAEHGVVGLTAIESKGHGRQLGNAPQAGGPKLDVWFVPKMVLLACVPDAQVQPTIDTITQLARTEAVGDGKIFVLPVSDVVRIRTGETGEIAL